jgi:hypothetical protein
MRSTLQPDMHADTPPIACTLTPSDHARRVSEIAALNRAALRRLSRDGPTLALTYAPEAAARVRALVDAERRCCAFLSLEIEETGDAVRLLVTAPDLPREALDELFAPFVAGSHADERASGVVAAAVGSTVTCGAGACAEPGSSCGCATVALSAPPATSVTARAARACEPRGAGRLPAAAAATAASAAVACGVCCLAPIALPAAMLSIAGGAAAVAASSYGWMRWIAMALVGAGWLSIWSSRRRRGRAPARATTRTLGFATLMLVAAFGWPRIEPLLRAALARH